MHRAFQNLVRLGGGGGGGGADSTPCATSYFKADDHEIWWCHTISKALPGTNKTFDDVMIMMFL